MLIVAGRGPLSSILRTLLIKEQSILYVSNISIFTWIRFTFIPKDSTLLLLADSNNLIASLHIVLSCLLLCSRSRITKLCFLTSSDSFQVSDLRNGKFIAYNGYDYYSLRKNLTRFLLQSFLSCTSTYFCSIIVGICIHPALSWGKLQLPLGSSSKIFLPLGDSCLFPVTDIQDLALLIREVELSPLTEIPRLQISVRNWISAKDLVSQIVKYPVNNFIYLSNQSRLTYGYRELFRTVLKIIYSFSSQFLAS